MQLVQFSGGRSNNNRILTETKIENGVNEVTEYEYDENGNTRFITIDNDETEYFYNARNQQIRIEGTLIVNYTYYPDGLRRSKHIAGFALEQFFVWSGGNMVYQYESLTPTQGIVYVYGINLISSRNNSGVEKFYLYNAHGDVVQLVNSSGTVVKEYQYDAFGVECDPDANDTNYFRYTGQYFDTESGTYYLRARYYNPANGRFTQQDGWGYLDYGDPLSLNLFIYCNNNPVMYTDPSGHILVTTCILIASIVIGAIAAGVTAYQSYKCTGQVDWVNTIAAGLSWFMLAYSLGMSAYACYLSYCTYKGYTPVTEIKFNGNAQVSTGNSFKGGASYTGIRNEKNDFQSGRSLAKHYTDHGKSMGFSSQSEYEKAAANFATKESTSTTLSFTSERGWYFRYDTATNEFAIINEYGGISTYMIPDNGINYWYEQVAKYST